VPHRYRGAVDANRRLAWGGAGLLTAVILVGGGFFSILVGVAHDATPYVGIVLLGLAIGGVVGALLGLFFRHLRPVSVGYLLGVAPGIAFVALLTVVSQ